MDKVYFRFHHCHIVLRATLQYETSSQRREVGDAGYVKEHILGKHCGQACENFLRPPALTLEIHDVRLHEHGAAISENRHRLCGESEIGILFNAQSKSFRR